MQVLALKFADLTFHPDLQIRKKGLDAAHVDDIRRAFLSKTKGNHPGPGRVFDVDGTKFVTRGHHRIAGAKEAGIDRLPFEVVVGTFKDARLDAIASNAGNGLKYSNDDKRGAVEQCLELCGDWSQEEVAEHCGVSHKFVSDIFAEQAALIASESEGEFVPGTNSPSPKPRVSKRNRKGEGRPNKKEENGTKVGMSLKRDANRSNEDIASETGTKVEFVARIRKSLEKNNLIGAREVTKPIERAITTSQPKPEAKPKAGRELFDWRNFDSHFGVVARGPDAIANAYPCEKNSTHHKECLRLLTEFRAAWETWQKHVTKSQGV